MLLKTEPAKGSENKKRIEVHFWTKKKPEYYRRNQAKLKLNLKEVQKTKRGNEVHFTGGENEQRQVKTKSPQNV